MNTKIMTSTILAALLTSATFVNANTAFATESQKTKDVKEMLRLTNANALGQQVGNALLANFRASFPQVPETFWKEIQAELDKFDNVNMLTPIYEKNFSHEDIKALIAFYKTPTGQRFLDVQPVLTHEAMLAGQKWGEQAAQNIITKLQEQGYR